MLRKFRSTLRTNVGNKESRKKRLFGLGLGNSSSNFLFDRVSSLLEGLPGLLDVSLSTGGDDLVSIALVLDSRVVLFLWRIGFGTDRGVGLDVHVLNFRSVDSGLNVLAKLTFELGLILLLQGLHVFGNVVS